MGIRRRGDKWLVTVELGRDELGYRRRAHATCDTESEAKREYARLSHEAYEGRHIKPSSESVASFCARYLADHKSGLRGSTYLRNAGIQRVQVERDLSRVPLSQFTPKAASKWKAKLLADGLAPATVRKVLIYVSAAMELAVAWRVIADNPLRHIELPEEVSPPFHVYTVAEQAALLAAAAPSDGDPGGYHVGRCEGALYVPVALTLGTGLRKGELLGLEVGDFDAASGRLHVRRALGRDAAGRDVLGPCKTKRSERVVVLPDSLCGLLTAHIARRPRLRTKRLFISLRGAPYTLAGFDASWDGVKRRAAAAMVRDAAAMHDPHASHAGDELRRARFHDLRHTHATELLRAGVHIKVVAERLGDSETTVMRVYSHVLPDMQEQAVAAIEPLLRGLLG